MSNGKDKPNKRGKITIPTANVQSSLDPITNLPVIQEHIVPPDVTDSYDLYRSVNPGTHPGQLNTPDVSELNFYGMDDVTWDVDRPDKVDYRRAMNQSGWEQFGAFLNQSIVGEVFGGTVEGIGAMLDYPINWLIEEVTGEKQFQDYENFLTKMGSGVREWTMDATPIYQKSTAKWNPSDSGWWAQNGVSVASTLSLLIPAAGAVRAVGMAGKMGRMVAGAGKLSKNAKVAKTFAKAENLMTLSKTGKWLAKSTVMGVSMRHMENFREASETYKVSLDKNYEFLRKGENLENFLNSGEGEKFKSENGFKDNSEVSAQMAANYLASNAASHSYNMNWANVGFDILQSALFLKGARIGRTRTGTFSRPSKAVKKAQNNTLKNPKIPKTKVGKFVKWAKPVVPWAAWSYSEGMEEQWNFISMQEGIRRGDIMAGNTGWMNEGFMPHEMGFGSRIKRYFADDELWTSTLFGSIGGGVFTTVSNLKNRKAQAALNEQRIIEIGQRSEFIQKALDKKNAALERGDLSAAEEQDMLLGMNLAISAANAGNVDMLIEMLNDPAFEETLQKAGVPKAEVEANKNSLIKVIENTEKIYQKYTNRITDKKWGPGTAQALTQLETLVNIYDELVNNVTNQIAENEQNDVYSKDQFSIGPNTKARYDAMTSRKMLEEQLASYETMRTRAAAQSQDKSLTKQERKNAEEITKAIDNILEPYKAKLVEAQKEEIKLKAESQETYDSKALAEENKFLDTINSGGEQSLKAKKEEYKYHRDTAWQAMQDILNGESVKTKNKEGKISDTSFKGKEDQNTKLREEATVNNEEAIKVSVENRAILEDFRTLINKNPDLTEDQVREFFAQYPDNAYIQEQGREILNNFIKSSVNNSMHTMYEELYAQANQTAKEVSEHIDEKIEALKKEIFDPKLSRKEQARRVQMEQDYKEAGGRGAKILYGVSESQDYLIKNLFDNYTTVVPVVWGEKVGAIYRDTETNELIFREGATNKEYIIQEEISNKEFLDSNGKLMEGPSLGYLDMLLLRDSNYNINIVEDGRTFNIEGEYFNNLASDPTTAIEYDTDANVVSVTLTKWDGTKVTFTSPGITYELADLIETLEAVKRTRFNELVKDDFLIIEHEGKEYIISYEEQGLTAKDINGKPLKDNLNEIILRKANIQLSNAIQNEINNLKTEYNETITATNAVASPVTETNLMSPEVGESENAQEAEKREESKIIATNTTVNPKPSVKQSKTEQQEQERLLTIQENKVEIDQSTSDEKTAPIESAETRLEELRNEVKALEAQLETEEGKTHGGFIRSKIAKLKAEIKQLEAVEEQLEVIEATTNTQTGQTTEEQESTIVTDNTPTTAGTVVLNKTYPRAWSQQFMGVPESDKSIAPKGFLTIRDANGNLIPVHSSTSGAAYVIKNAKDMSNEERRLLNEGSERVKTLHYFEPQVDSNNNTILEGSRVIESESLKQYQREGEFQVIVFKADAIKESDIIRMDLANSAEVGIGTNIILRVEPSNPYYKPPTAEREASIVITVRLASNPSIILAKLTKGDRFRIQNAKLRAKIEKMYKGERTVDIQAKIAGKTNGFVINQKTNGGESLQQPISILGPDITLGIHQGESGIVYNNTDIPSHKSVYSENGYIYAAIKSASGRMVPVRISTATLSEASVQVILDTLTTDTLTAKDKQAIVNQIVHIPLGSRKDDNFKLGGKMKRILAMDNFVLKIPFGDGRVIGIQYNMEGSEQYKRNNLKNALEDKEFFFKLYDEQGNLTSGEGAVIGTAGSSVQKNSLLSSKLLDLQPGQVKAAILEHLSSKVYHVEKNKINTKDQYFSPLRQEPFNNYLDYLAESGILTTDIPGVNEQQFHHAAIYVEVSDEIIEASQSDVPSFMTGAVEVMGTPEIIIEQEQQSLEDLLAGQVPDELKDKKTEVPGKGKIDEINPDNIDEEFKLREYENLEGNYDIITEGEKAWFLSRFGEEGLELINRVKYLMLKDGRQAYGYYHKGMATVASAAKEGTIYWEGFRRIYDMHLTPEEKNSVEMEALEKWNISGEEVETKLASEFMKYKLNQNEKGLGAKVKRFFRELWYYMKNMMGMKNEIQRLFRDLNTREFTKYTAEEAAALSEVTAPKLREKKGFAKAQVEEIVGGINFNLIGTLKENYGENWMDQLSNGAVIKSAYESVRQNIAGKAIKINNLTEKSEDLTRLGKTYATVSEPSIWYDQADKYGNIVSPGFITLATKELENIGVKYKVNQKGGIDFNKAPGIETVTEEISEEITDYEEVQTETKQHIFNINFYHTPVKDTLSRDIKIGLSFIKSKEKGKVFGNYRYVPFDEVYAYLSIALANTPTGDVITRLSQLAEKGAHPLVNEVVEVYGQATKQWQNKFASHFNKQNIRFKTLIIEDGAVKVVFTNRNGLEKQIISKWIDNRGSTEIYIPTTGKPDLINDQAVKKLDELYKETQRLSKLGNKKDYLISMFKTLEYAGISLGNEVYRAMLNDDTMQIADLHSYMVGNRSFEHILKGLKRAIPTSPYLAGSAETSTLRRLASLAAAFRIDNYGASFLSGAKKPIYAINLNTYDSKLTLKLRSDETYEQVILDRFRDTFYSPTKNMRHLILDMLLTNPEVRANFQLSTFDVIKEKGNAGRATAFDGMSQLLSAQTRFSMFFNSGLEFGEFNTGTKADKSQSKYITLPKISPDGRFNSLLWKSGNDRSYNGWVKTAVELLKPAVYGELARIAKTNKQLFGNNPISIDEQIKNIHYRNVKGDNEGNGLSFIAFPELNDPRYNFFTPHGKLNNIFENLSSMASIESQRIDIGDALTRYVKDNIASTMEALELAGTITKRNNKYENINLPGMALSGKTVQGDISPALVEFAVNDLVYRPYINTTFGPDLAYYQTDENGNPIIDAGKRAYQSVTPGIDAVWNEDKQYGLPNKFSHAILQDVFKDKEEHIQKILETAGVESKEAKRIARAYKKVNATDAQGFTTLDFHRKQMESDGTWTQEHDDAYNKYWSKGLMGDAKARSLILDPRKTYYYGERVITDSQGNETVTWEQIKHSTIPLLREFTELYKETPGENKVTLNQLRIRMEDKQRPIDMVNFVSALKIGASGVMDYETDSLDTIKINYLSTDNLRSPQTIKTKIGDSLDGTQMAKLILANIEDKNYYSVFGEKVNGKDLKTLYNDIYAERIKRSHDKLVKKLGIESYREALDNRTTIGEEQFGKEELQFLQKTRDVIIESLDNRSLADNYYLALNINELMDDVNKYGFESPLSFPPFAKRFESILLSLFKNKVLKQRFNGMSAVQVAEFGWNTDKELQIKQHKNGGVYAEVALPYEMAVKLGLKPGDITEDSDIYDLLGYRIPTQGKNSMISLKVVKILPDNMGGVIMFPAEITTIMGSDFDVDKMYLMFPELSKSKSKIGAFSLEKFKNLQSFEGLSDEAITNSLFDIRNAILTSKHHAKEILDPLDSPTYSQKLEQYEKLDFIDNISGMNINSFAADMYLEKINKDAGMLIGLFSLQATGHAMAQQMNVTLKNGYAVNIHADGKKSHTNLSKIIGFDGKYISVYLSEDQNESLDNAKHQRIGRVGVTVYNSGVVGLLNRIGFNNSVTLDFINQPILREFFARRGKADPGVTDIQIAKEIAGEMNSLATFEDMQYRGEILFTPSASSLEEDLTVNYKAEDKRTSQLQILSDFLDYVKAGRDLSKFNGIASPETMKNTSRLSYFERYNNNLNYINGPESSIKIGNSVARLEAYRKYGLGAAVNFASEFIPYNVPGFLELKKNIATITGQRDRILQPELTDVINGMALYWSLTKKTSPFGAMIYEKNETLQKYLFTAEGSLLKTLNKVKQKYNLTNDPFFGMLFGHESNVSLNNYLQTIAFNNTTKLSASQLTMITDRWQELLQDPREDVRVMAENLVKYAVITSGFMLTPNSFVDLVPISYWQSSGLTEYFRKEARTMNYENYFDGTTAEQIIRNMFTDQGLLMTLDAESVETSEQVRKGNAMGANEYFIHKKSNAQILVESVEPGVQNYVGYFKSFIGGKFRLFKYMRSTKTGGVYKEIAPLGTRFRHVEMQADNLNVTSINPQNTLRYAETTTEEDLTLKQRTEESSSSETNGNFMPRLTPVVKEAVLHDLDTRIEAWLMKNFNIPVKKYDNLKKKLGVDAIGVADMANRVVEVDNNRDRYTLPEEAGHFYIEMMESPAFDRLIKLVGATQTYQQVLKDYNGIYDNELDFKKEAAGQILGKFIVGTYTKEIAKEDYGDGLLGTLQKIWDSIKRFFKRIGIKESINDLNSQLTEVLGPAASAIIEGVNPGGLSIENIGINKYYALTRPKIEFRDGDGNIIDIGGKTKGVLRRINRFASTKVPYLKTFTQKDAINELILESEQIIAPTPTNNYYMQDGVKLNRVSNLMEVFQDPFNQQEMAEKVALANQRKGDPFNTADKVQGLWDFLRDDMGTGLHNIMQGIVERSDMESILNSLPQEQREAYREAIPQLTEWVRNREKAGSTLYAETMIGDKTDLIGGTVDIIEVTSDGRKILWDLKTKVKGKFGNIEKKLPSFKGALSQIPNTLLNKYRLQLSLYKHIIEEKGIIIDQINILPLEAEVTIDDASNITFSKVNFPDSNLQVLNKLNNLQPIKRKVLKRVVSFVSPASDEAGIKEQKEADTLLRVFEKAKGQVARKVARYKKDTDSQEYRQKLETLYDELDEITEKEGLVLFTKRAVRDINAAYSRLHELQKTDSLNARVLNQILEFVKAYDILDEITLMAPLMAESGYENVLEKYVQPAIAKRELVKEEYKALIRPIIAETLGKLSNNPDMSVEKLEAELLIASRDITWGARWLDALGDSKDTTLAMVNKLIQIQRTKVREATNNLRYGTKTTEGLMDLITELEKYQHAHGVNLYSSRDVYDFMLETTEDGPTGRVVTKYTPEFRALTQKFIEDNTHLDTLSWNTFYKEHNPKDYLSPKFAEIERMNEEDPRKKFYLSYVENYNYAQSILPRNYQRGAMLPSLRASAAERIMEKKGNIAKRSYDAMKETMGEYFVKHEDNVSFGEYVDAKGDPLDYVPIHYTRGIGNAEGQTSPENLSYDLGNGLQMFYTMAVNFQQMNDIMPEIEGAKELVKTRRVKKLKAGMPIKDQITGEDVSVAGEGSKAYQRLEDYFQMVVYGKRKKSEGSISIGGKVLNLEQVGDALLQLGSLRVLAMNDKAALANISFGQLMSWIEAFANDHYGMGNFAKAKTIYYAGKNDLGAIGLIQDVLARAPKSKIGLVNEHFDVLQEFDEYGNRLAHRKLGLRMNQGSLYFMMSMGEHMIQSQMAIAMMLNTKFKTSKGEINLWDAYKVVDGRLELDPEVEKQFGVYERAEFSEKVHAVYQRIHGIYNTKDRNAIQQYAMGRWAMQFRKWMRPGALRRFEGAEKLFYKKESEFKKPDYNERLQSLVEGNYVTAVKFMEALRKDMFGFQFFTLGKQYKKLEPWQQANLRRSLGEVMSFILLFVLGGLYDEKKEEGTMTALDWRMLYNIKRINAELLFFNPFGSSFYEILRTPAANMTSIEAYGKLGSQLVEDMLSVLTGGDFERYKRKTGQFEKGDAKLNKYWRNVLPLKEWFTDPQDKIKFFDLQ